MILDCHIHMGTGARNDGFSKELAQAGVSGGIILSPAPACFGRGEGNNGPQRLAEVMACTAGDPNLYPIFWIDPLEEDAEAQVDRACAAGIRGFKVICDRYYPYEDRPMAIFRRIADAGKPILFHSGILWDGKFSSLNNRPANFERLIEIKNLRFALAHASWPWCDECIALYGKLLDAKRYGNGTEMFIDVTPGTPPIYRRELLTKLFTVGYDVENNVIFGSDCGYDQYGSDYAKSWIERDREIYRELSVSEEVQAKVFGENLKRFVGVSE